MDKKYSLKDSMLENVSGGTSQEQYERIVKDWARNFVQSYWGFDKETVLGALEQYWTVLKSDCRDCGIPFDKEYIRTVLAQTYDEMHAGS